MTRAGAEHFACTAHADWFPVAFSLLVCVYVYTHTPVHAQKSQIRRGQFAAEGSRLLVRWFCVIYKILLTWRSKIQAAFIFTTPGLPPWFLKIPGTNLHSFLFWQMPASSKCVCLCSNSPLSVSAALARFSHHPGSSNSRILVLILHTDLYGTLEHFK